MTATQDFSCIIKIPLCTSQDRTMIITPWVPNTIPFEAGMIGEIRLRNCACERRLPHFWESLCFVNLVCGDVIMAMIIRTANLTCQYLSFLVCSYCVYGLFLCLRSLWNIGRGQFIIGGRAVNHYVTPIFSRQKLCKLNSSPTRVQAEQVKFSHLRGSFLAHFIKAEVYLWQVHIPMFCYVYRFLQPLADVIRTILRTVELFECHWLACCFKTMTPETVGGFHSTKNSEIAGPKLNGTVKIPGLFECTLFDGISGIIENFVFHSQEMSGLVSLPSVGDRTIRFPVCHTPRNETT